MHVGGAEAAMRGPDQDIVLAQGLFGCAWDEAFGVRVVSIAAKGVCLCRRHDER